MASSIIVDGLQPEKTLEMIMLNNIKIDDFSEVYEKMHQVCDEIISMGNESMRKARETLPPNSVVSFDGSWEHRRKAMRCLFSVICNKTGQVIDSIVVSNKVPRNDPTARYLHRVPPLLCSRVSRK